MANTTPSQSIKLGANLQEQLGDLKGAAKTLNDEARAAQVEVRAANREIKELEKRKKKGETVDVGSAVNRKLELERKIEVKKQRADDLKVRAKEDQAFKGDINKRLGGFERLASSQLYSVKDSLNMVSKRLIQTQNGVASSVGRSIGAVSSKITPGLISGVAKIAGPIGAAYAGYQIGSKFVDKQHEFRDRAKQVAEIQGASAENIRRTAQSFVTQDLPKEFLKNFNQITEKAGAEASASINREDLIKYDFGKILTGLGVTGSTEKELRTEKRKSEIAQEKLTSLAVAEQYGQIFADKFSIKNLMESKEVETAWKNHLQERGLGNMWMWQDAETALGEEKFKRDLSTGMRNRAITAEATGRAQEKATAAQDPEAEAERHIRSSRRNGLERQRLHGEMQWNKF